MTFDPQVLDELSSKFSLADYVKENYDAEWRSGKWFIHCPKHEDDTPSMSIDPEWNNYYCFSCKRYGGPIKWFRDIEGLTFQQSVDRISSMVGVEASKIFTNETTAFLRTMGRRAKKHKSEKPERNILDSSMYYGRYDDEIPKEWVTEGISEEALKKYEVRIDRYQNRIVYPVYDNEFNLIGVKGRTRIQNYDDFGIRKYSNYYSIGTVDFFTGMKQAKPNIVATKEMIVFEGIKSCMKAYDYGFYNTVSAETNTINEHQVKIILQMHIRDVVIAFDKGVDIKVIKDRTSALRKFTNVYVVQDTHGLLDDKMSPVDKGKDVWLRLYNERTRI